MLPARKNQDHEKERRRNGEEKNRERNESLSYIDKDEERKREDNGI